MDGQNDKDTTGRQSERLGSAWMSDDAILAVCDAAGFTKRQMAELTTVRWADGIDIQVPTFPLKRFVQMLIEPNNVIGATQLRTTPDIPQKQ